MIVDDYLPAFDVSDSVALVVEADLATTWTALLDVDLIEVGRRRPMVGLLGALRILPGIVSHLLHGDAPPHAPSSLRLHEMTTLPPDQGGWVLLGERAQAEIALGLVGRFWRPIIEFAPMPTADAFRSFNQPGYAKTVYSLAVRSLDPRRTLLTGMGRRCHPRRSIPPLTTGARGFRLFPPRTSRVSATRAAARRRKPRVNDEKGRSTVERLASR